MPRANRYCVCLIVIFSSAAILACSDDGGDSSDGGDSDDGNIVFVEEFDSVGDWALSVEVSAPDRENAPDGRPAMGAAEITNGELYLEAYCSPDSPCTDAHASRWLTGVSEHDGPYTFPMYGFSSSSYTQGGLGLSLVRTFLWGCRYGLRNTAAQASFFYPRIQHGYGEQSEQDGGHAANAG